MTLIGGGDVGSVLGALARAERIGAVVAASAKGLPRYSDADRARLATKRGTTMLGPAEQGRCEHGKLYSFRWKWPVGGSPEDSDVEILSQGCKECNAEDDSE